MASSQLTKPTESAPVVVVARDPTAELAEVLDFFRFAVKPTSTWSGTAVFDIWKSELNPRLVISIRVHPDRSVETWFGLPPDGKYTCYSECSRDDFFLVYSGAASPAAVASMVLTGRIRVRWFRYLDVQNFGLSYDFSTPAWVAFYRSRGEALYADQLMLQHWRRLEPKGLFIDENGNVVDPKTVSPERAAELLKYCRGLESTPAVSSAAKSASIVTSAPSATTKSDAIASSTAADVQLAPATSTSPSGLLQAETTSPPEEVARETPAAAASDEAEAEQAPATTVVDEVATIVHANASRVPMDDVSAAVEMALLMRELLDHELPTVEHIRQLQVSCAFWPTQRAGETFSRCFALSQSEVVIPAAPSSFVASNEEDHAWDRFTTWLRSAVGLGASTTSVPAAAPAPSSAFDLDAAAEKQALHRSVAHGVYMAAYACGEDSVLGRQVRTWMVTQTLPRAATHLPTSVAPYLPALRRSASLTTARMTAVSSDALRMSNGWPPCDLVHKPLHAVDAVVAPSVSVCAGCINLSDVAVVARRRCMTTAELIEERTGRDGLLPAPSVAVPGANSAHDRLRAFATDMAASMDMRSHAHAQGMGAHASPVTFDDVTDSTVAMSAPPILVRAARHMVTVADGVAVDVDELAASAPMPEGGASLYTPVTRAWVSPVTVSHNVEDVSTELAAERDTLTYVRHVRAHVASCRETVLNAVDVDPVRPLQTSLPFSVRASSWAPLLPPPLQVALTGAGLTLPFGSPFIVTPEWMNSPPRTPYSISGMCAAVLRACTRHSEALSLAHAETMLYCLGAPVCMYRRPLVTLGAAQTAASVSNEDVDVFLLPVWHPRRLCSSEQLHAAAGKAAGSPGASSTTHHDDDGLWATSKHTPTAYLGYGASLFASTARASARARYDREAVDATAAQMMRAARGQHTDDASTQLAPWLTGPFSHDEMGLSTESLARGFADAVRHMTHRIKDSRMLKLYKVDAPPGTADGPHPPRSDVLRRIRRRILGVKGERGDDVEPPAAVHVPGFGLASVGVAARPAAAAEDGTH